MFRSSLFIYRVFLTITLVFAFSACENNDGSNPPVDNPQNLAPFVDAGSDQITEGSEEVTLLGIASDSDGEIVDILWRETTDTVIIQNATGLEASFIALPVAEETVLTLTLTVQDDDGASATDTLMITVNPQTSSENILPDAEAGEDQTVQSGSLVTLVGNASDNDGIIAHTLWRSLNLNIALVNDDLLRVSFVAPSVSEQTPFEFEFTATDDQNGRSQDSLAVTVLPQDVTPDDNNSPVAKAGRDVSVAVGEQANLSAHQSYDLDGDLLNFEWVIVSAPSGSSAIINNPNLLRPHFIADAPGEYRINLLVDDDQSLGLDSINISTINTPPLADAGENQVFVAGDTLQLNANASTDVDGDFISFSWALTSQPETSSTNLVNPDSFSPTIEVDQEGEYVIRLQANDGTTDGEVDSVTLSSGSLPLTAKAGQDITVAIGQFIQLEADNASDANAGFLNYQWSIVSAPEGSQAALNSSTIFNPQISVDVAGDYLVQLIVSQNNSPSQPDQLIVSTINTQPLAHAGSDQQFVIGETAVLDGSASSDFDSDPLSYDWALIYRPDNSNSVLNEITSASSTFVPDQLGTYLAQLMVNDGTYTSLPDTVQIDVVAQQANEAVLITSTPITGAQLDQAYQYQIIASDPDNDPIEYALVAGPLGLTLNTNGLIEWKPSNGESVELSVSATDNINAPAIQSFTITVAGQDANAPVIDAVGNQTALLGETFHLNLTASDPNGDALTFIASPLPLPENFSLNAVTGDIRFKPALNQVGDFQLALSVTDGRFSDSEVIIISVPEPSGITSLVGRVLTQGDTPLPGVTLEVDGVTTQSDANGDFVFSDLSVSGAGNVRLLVDGSSVDLSLGAFATVPETIPVMEGVANRLEVSIYLLPLDVVSADPVDPTTTSLITSSRFSSGSSISEPVTLTIPPGSAIDDSTGEPFVGDIHISRVEDPALGPQPLPEGIGLGVYIAIQPFGVTYPDPVPISFPNLENFPPGSRLDFFALNHETGAMEKIGEGLVSSDGRTVDSIGGVVKSNSWHGIVPQQPQVTPDQPPNQNEPSPSDNPEDPPCNCNCSTCNCEGGACRIDKQTGNLSEDHFLPAYYTLGVARSLRIEYNSNSANVQPIIPMISGFGNQAPPPESMSLEINVGGIAYGQKRYSEVTVEPSEIRGQFKTTRPAIQFDGSNLLTGIHDYEITVECQFPISFRSDSVTGQVIIDNKKDSAFGAGWSLAGLQKLYFHESGNVLLTTGSKTSLIYTPLENGAYQSPPGDYSTFVALEDGSFFRRLRTGEVYVFDGNGRQISLTDRNGNITRYEYNAQSQIERIVDPVNKFYRFTYQNGYLNSISDPLQRVTQFEHDAFGNLIRIIEPNGDARSFEYQQNAHLMNAQTDQRGNRKQYTYNFAGRIQEATLPDNSILRIDASDTKGLIPPEVVSTREQPAPAPLLVEDLNNSSRDFNGNLVVTESDVLNVPTRYTDSVSRTIEYVRDENSNATQTTRANQSVVNREFNQVGKAEVVTEAFNQATYRYGYDEHALVTEHTNPNQHQTLFNRDESSNITSIVNHLGHTAEMDYDNRGLVMQMITPNGLEVNYTYNESGLVSVMEEIPPQDSPGNTRITQYRYDEAGQMIRVITPDNIALSLSYDDKGRMFRIRDNLNQSIQYTYDEYNNVVALNTLNSDGSLALTVNSVFDNRNRLEESSMPHVNQLESLTQYALDNNSNLSIWTDPNGAFESNEYDAEDRLITNTHRMNGITRYEYDTNDRMTRVEAPNGVVTLYTYDVLGRRLTESSSDRGLLSYVYDQANNLVSMTDGRGITITYGYDELERVTVKTFPNTIDGKIENVTYSYDSCLFGIGRLCGRIDESGTYTYAYDAYGNVVSETRTELNITYTTNYMYDNGNNLTQIIYPTGRVINIGRDGIRRTQSVSTTVNGTSQPIVENIIYRADHQMSQCTFGNGLLDSRQYDLQGRLTYQQLLNTSSAQMIDERSYAYDLNSNMLNKSTTPQDNIYQYDPLDRLIGDQANQDNPFTYVYDANHNRQGKNQNNNDQELVAETYLFRVGSNRLLERSSFRQNSSTESSATQRRVYNNANRLFQVWQNDLLIAEYIYNDAGQRTRKTVFNDQQESRTTVYHYDLYGNLIAETAEGGSAQREYIWSVGMTPAAQIDRVNNQDQLSYLHTDHLYTPRFSSDNMGQIQWRWDGESFGQTAANDNAGVIVNLRFPGQYFDVETGLHYNWNRYYDPQTGRYVQSDPLGLFDGPNTYSYVYNNPLSYTDPTGEFGVVGAGIGAAIDLGFQLAANGGNLKCVNWGQVAVSAGLGAIGGGLANGLAKGAFKFKGVGSNSWSATKHWGRSRNIKTLQAGSGQQRHHWLLQQNQGWGKNISNRIKNQPWNINPVSAPFNNWMAKGSTNFRSLLGAPPWAKGVAGGGALAGGGAAANAAGAGGGNCGCP